MKIKMNKTYRCERPMDNTRRRIASTSQSDVPLHMVRQVQRTPGRR